MSEQKRHFLRERNCISPSRLVQELKALCKHPPPLSPPLCTSRAGQRRVDFSKAVPAYTRDEFDPPNPQCKQEQVILLVV